MAILAWIYRQQGRWKEAEKLEVQVLEIIKKELGQEHVDTLNSMYCLAETYSNQEWFKEAQELLVQVLKIR